MLPPPYPTKKKVEEANCQNSHAVLLDKLKESEINFLTLQQDLSDREREIEQTEELMLEKHHEALSWETKWKLAEEARKYQHAELAATGEIGMIKSEIHRMEVRYNQLKRAQEKLSQDMESCVGHRDHVYERACAREKLPENKGRSKNSGHYRVTELKIKLKQVRNETVSVERNISEVTIQKDEMHSELRKLKDTIDNERLQDSLLQSEIEQTILMKQEVCISDCSPGQYCQLPMRLMMSSLESGEHCSNATASQTVQRSHKCKANAENSK